MSTIKVHTQDELDAALTRTDLYEIVIDSPRGVWLTVAKASGSATVRASGSATVRAYGSATVEASGSATVEASDSATVRAYGSATVEASGSATVRAYGSATVRAYGSATVEASGSATVEASGSATVRAAKYVAVHLFSALVTLDGGVLIDMTKVDPTNTADWLDLTGCDQDGDDLIVYKAVRDDYQSAMGQQWADGRYVYTVGAELTDHRWIDNHDCGNGLHFSPTAARAFDHDTEATRFLRCAVKRADARTIDTSKLKAPSCRVLAEVDKFGRDLVVAKAGS